MTKIKKPLVIVLGIFFLGVLYAVASQNPLVTPTNDQTSENTDVVHESEIEEFSSPENVSISSLDSGPTATIIPREVNQPATIIDQTTLVETDNYAIMYYEQSDKYAIILLNTPLDTHQREAEDSLLENLNIERITACKLDIEIKVPRYVSDVGTSNRSVSFCN